MTGFVPLPEWDNAATIIDVPAAVYHADDLGTPPTLSSSVAKTLLRHSPLHAWTEHPRLNPNYAPLEDAKYDLGTVVHAMLLTGENVVVPVDAADWRTNAAKDARDEIRAAGKVPLLLKDFARAREMHATVRVWVESHPAGLLTAGKPEQTILWEEQGVWCRARVDWLHDDHAAIDDLKTTSASAEPYAWARTAYGFGADVQVAFYLRGLKAVSGLDAEFRFVVVETMAPYAISVCSLSQSALDLANSKVDYALETWRRCLETGVWPGYPEETTLMDAPGYEVARWLA